MSFFLRSDVLGHILPIVGKDWAQSGVAQLFTKIKNNGYKLLYLSARAIGQARVTRDYLKSIKQGDLSLPDGPLLLNPTSLISAFHRYVKILKKINFNVIILRVHTGRLLFAKFFRRARFLYQFGMNQFIFLSK